MYRCAASSNSSNLSMTMAFAVLLQFKFFLLLCLATSLTYTKSSHALAVKETRKSSGFYVSKGNPIDDCWYLGQNWSQNRQKLATCGAGFGSDARGGAGGAIYVVTSAEDDPASPQPGTLRHAVTQPEPLWIIFETSMTFDLQEELLISSYKTIDGRGADVHFNGSWCLVVESVTNVIIHGIHVTGCKRPPGYGTNRTLPQRSQYDGDGIKIVQSQHVWVDHCRISFCADGLLDVTKGSNYTSITNNYFEHNIKVMLLGHSATWVIDKLMLATVAFNHFGEGAQQRMPRCRYGNFHVANNFYFDWGMYAIGGSSAPTIYSEGNYFVAGDAKEVTKRWDNSTGNWCSVNDIFVNGSYFVSSGEPKESHAYDRAKSFKALHAHLVPQITSQSGPLKLSREIP